MERMRRNDQPSTSKALAPAAKMDRKTVEKNRRVRMNSLLRTLFRLIPQHFNHSKDQKVGVAELLEQATGYVAQLRETVHKLRQRKDKLTGSGTGVGTAITGAKRSLDDGFDSAFPVLKVVAMWSTNCLQVDLIERASSENERVLVSEVVRVLEEEGTEVVGMNIVTFNHKHYHTINAQVKSPRVQVDTIRIAGRLHELIPEYN